MAHRLLQPPGSTLQHRLRLPRPQRITETLTAQLLGSTMPRDAFRTVKTSQSQICTGVLAPPQIFAISRAGGTNSPENMRNGLRVGNAARLVDKTRGQSAGA